MRIIQTVETVWAVDETALADLWHPEYEEWRKNGGTGGPYGFVKAEVAELGTEIFGLRLIQTETEYAFGIYEDTE